MLTENGGIMYRLVPPDDRENVIFCHYEKLSFELNLCSRILPEQNTITDLYVQRDQFSSLLPLARPDGNDPSFLGLLLRCVRDNDAATAALLVGGAGNHDAVVQWTDRDTLWARQSIPAVRFLNL